MRKSYQLFVVIILTTAISILYYLQFRPESKIVYVESIRLINNYQGMIDARADYQRKISTWKSNIDTLSSEVQKSLRAYQSENAKMSLKEKELSEELIKTKQRQLSDYQKAMNNKAAEEDNQLTSKIIAEVNSYLAKYGEEHNYQIIIAATEYGNVVYARQSLNITDEVLEGLNAKYQGR